MSWQPLAFETEEWDEKLAFAQGVLEELRTRLTIPSERLPREAVRILECVHRDLFDPELNVAAVRRRCGLRNNNISTRFRQAVGVGLRDYIESIRIRAASFLLRYPDLEIHLIGKVVGYVHQETFCRAFRRCADCTPSQWRETSVPILRRACVAPSSLTGGGAFALRPSEVR
ncbi:MAG: helix-turn-helix transcriptional regulator [Acidobacteriota bacterium]